MILKASSSLRRNLIARLLWPTLLLLSGAGVLPYGIAIHFSNIAYDRWLYDSAFTLAQQVEHNKSGTPAVLLPKAAIEMFEWDITDSIYYAVTAFDGTHVFGFPTFPPVPPGLVLGPTPSYYDAQIDGKSARIVALSMEAMPGDEAVMVRVAETRVKRDALVRELLADVLAYQIALMLIAVALVWFGIRKGLQPLTDLTEQIGRRSQLDLGPLEEDVPQEVQPLVQSLNDLLTRLSAAHSAQKRFIADASHQLRTPLAALQIQAERALREQDPASRSEALRRVSTSIGRLTHVAQQLLSLAKADPESGSPRNLEQVDLARAAQEITSEWVPKALSQRSDLGYSGPENGVPIAGEAQMLKELISNLIDNSLLYAGPASSITVGVEMLWSEAILYVEDNGPGIPEEVRDKVFERFYRLSGSDGSGCGLGLAIVKEIANMHHAGVRIAAGSDGKGSRITIIFKTHA